MWFRNFLKGYHKSEGKLPDWIIEALELANVSSENIFDWFIISLWFYS